MAKVGFVNFNSLQNGERYGEGRITTLKLDFTVRFVAVPNRQSMDSPAFDIQTPQGVNLGAAWEKSDKNGGKYLSLTLDDPSFEAPLNLAAFKRDGDKFDLIWNRPTKAE